MFPRFKGLLGNRLRVLVTGGAQTSPAVKAFLRKCYPNVTVVDSYGITEVGNLLPRNTPPWPLQGGIATNNKFKIGVLLKLVDAPELGFFTTDKPYPRGEVCVQSPFMASGYYGDEELTKECFKDGWFHTGDIGVQKNKVTIEIIDRKKNIFKVILLDFVIFNVKSYLKENLFLQSTLKMCLLENASL
jgi:long-chain acyl-CoA synthetase